MACCTNTDGITDDEDYSLGPEHESTEVSDASGSGNDSQTRVFVPYTRCTPLFRAIEVQDWEGVLRFLNTAKWSNSLWNSTIDHLKSPAPHIQCKTWVISYKKGQEDWSQLPIHAAISYGAPAVVIQKLVEMYPASIQARDGEGMLPIHLAFGFGSSDTILGFLLRSWPASVNEAGPNGRLPHECCDLGPNKQRGEVFRIVAEQTGMAVQKSQDELWMRCVTSNSERLGMQDQNLQKRHLTDLLTELLEDRAQLQELKDKLRMKYGAHSGSTTLMTAGSGAVSPQSVKSGGSVTAAVAAKHFGKVSSPKSTGNDALIPSPRGKGSNPPWVIGSVSQVGGTGSRQKSPTHTVGDREGGLIVHAPKSPTKQDTPNSTKARKGWKRGGKMKSPAQ